MRTSTACLHVCLFHFSTACTALVYVLEIFIHNSIALDHIIHVPRFGRLHVDCQALYFWPSVVKLLMHMLHAQFTCLVITSLLNQELPL
jgi:hypothetical protein